MFILCNNLRKILPYYPNSKTEKLQSVYRASIMDRLQLKHNDNGDESVIQSTHHIH